MGRVLEFMAVHRVRCVVCPPINKLRLHRAVDVVLSRPQTARLYQRHLIPAQALHLRKGHHYTLELNGLGLNGGMDNRCRRYDCP